MLSFTMPARNVEQCAISCLPSLIRQQRDCYGLTIAYGTSSDRAVGSAEQYDGKISAVHGSLLVVENDATDNWPAGILVFREADLVASQ